MDVTFLGGVGTIGGNKFLLTDAVDKESRILLDFGMQFGDPESFAESDRAVGAMGAFFDPFMPVRAQSGLRDLLRLRILPEIDGLYRSDWLIRKDYRKAVTDHLGDVPFADYWETKLQSYDAFAAEHGRPFVDGILITHAHADHFQHLAFVDPKIPVYCTAVTRSIIKTAGDVAGQGDTGEAFEAKVRELAQAKGGNTPGAWKVASTKADGHIPRPYHVVEPWQPFNVGGFKVTAIPIDHSVPGACFFLIEGGDGKRVLYTGDFRFHGVYEDASAEAKLRLKGLQPDALLCEGTRIDSDHVVYERDVLKATTKRTLATKGLVLADWGWKDATRFLTMQQAAKAADRTLVVDSRVAFMLMDLARVDPLYQPIEAYGNVRVFLRRKTNMLYSPVDYKPHELGYSAKWDQDAKAQYVAHVASEDGTPAAPSFAHLATGIRAHDIRKQPDKFLLQLSFFQMNELFDLDPPADSYYIKSSCEPFNDEMRNDETKLMNWLDEWRIGNNVAENERGHHTSGHAAASELAEFWKIVEPQMLVPIHTERPNEYEAHWPTGNIQIPKYGETITI